MIRMIIMFFLWIYIFDLVKLAAIEQNILILVWAIICSYIMSVRLFPFFPYNHEEEENN